MALAAALKVHSSREGEPQLAGEAPATRGCAGVRSRFREEQKIVIVSSSREGQDARQEKTSLQAGVLYPARPLLEQIT